MTRILLTGKSGQVGSELLRILSCSGEIIAPDRATLDLLNEEALRRVVRDNRPEIIINAAAYTAVDRAESEPELAMAVNGIAPGVLAEEAKRLGAVLVHYSTDYVFDGKKPLPYTEEDAPNPQSVYGRTKLAGEQAIRASGCRHLILRTSWVYGIQGGNFLKTILKLAKERDELRIVADQFGAPTWARDIAHSTLLALMAWQMSGWDGALEGTYHLTAQGRTSWYDYAREIIRLARTYDRALAGRALAIHPIATCEYPVPAKRPANSSLAGDRLAKAFGIRLPEWQHSLADCLRELYTQPSAMPR